MISKIQKETEAEIDLAGTKKEQESHSTPIQSVTQISQPAQSNQEQLDVVKRTLASIQDRKAKEEQARSKVASVVQKVLQQANQKRQA